MLTDDAESDMFVPPFDRATLDDFAVKSEATFEADKSDPIELKIIGRLHAGDSPEKDIKKGECMQIATGAPMLEGADAIGKVEVTEKENDLIKIYQSFPPGKSFSPKGEDIERGKSCLKRNLFLTSARIGPLATMGEKVSVILF